jgi:FlaA1/EpsC-like NDP-sugar epimerase
MSEPTITRPQGKPLFGMLPNSGQLDAAVTRRGTSLFAPDIAARAAAIAEQIEGRRILIVGGGGSIGSITTQLVIDYRPSAVHVVDVSENYLAELVRTLRGRPEGLPEMDFRTIPIDYGGPIMQRLLSDAEPYDIVLNFAALKHVRSEKDVYSLLQMLDTNVLRHIRFKKWLAANGHGRRYFAVSTDKAANPTSLMGASKRLMEDVVFDVAADNVAVTTARFANVAFSNGSLLQGFLQRLQLRQPFAVPRRTQRYFVSQREAGELCVLAAFTVPDRHIAIPKMDPRTELQYLDDIAVRILKVFGLEPAFVEDEEEARRNVETLAASGRWPVLLTPLDTAGEKPYEEFVGEGETQIDIGLFALAGIPHRPSRAMDQGLFQRLDALINEPGSTTGKAEIIASIRDAMENFRHIESNRNLDQRL